MDALTRLMEIKRELDRSDRRRSELLKRRDEIILELFNSRCPVSQLVKATQLTRGRIYQIADQGAA